MPPEPLTNVRLVIFAGDHGVAAHGVSAYPPAITGAMVRTFVAGLAGVNALATAHDVHVRVLDIGVDEDLADVPEDVRAHKVRRGSGAIHLEDALDRRGDRARPRGRVAGSRSRRSLPARSCCSAATWASATPRRPRR